MCDMDGTLRIQEQNKRDSYGLVESGSPRNPAHGTLDPAVPQALRPSAMHWGRLDLVLHAPGSEGIFTRIGPLCLTLQINE